MDDRADTLSAIAQAINDALTVDGSRRCRRPALTCLISSGHFNLGERPRLLQLNNTAA
ncbi:hypothetical protein [Burkholderia pseudomallei]|uniref:hypothetical protein n=1 Tax=Burkholderia pseudomallei TaxID=28450 RepID=UPI0016055C0D|nr:hypothetical protein [Burkholderia pseudomallei]